MVCVYVRLKGDAALLSSARVRKSRRSQSRPRSRSGSGIKVLLLPDKCGMWDMNDRYVQRVEGRGVFPAWETQKYPVLMPYFGYETVTADAETRKVLLAVLHGKFETVSVGEVVSMAGVEQMADGIFAVPRRVGGDKLPDSMQLLQVFDRGHCYYLIADEAKACLSLTGDHEHLFNRLCKQEMPDLHLLTVRRQ